MIACDQSETEIFSQVKGLPVLKKCSRSRINLTTIDTNVVGDILRSFTRERDYVQAFGQHLLWGHKILPKSKIKHDFQ